MTEHDIKTGKELLQVGARSFFCKAEPHSCLGSLLPHGRGALAVLTVVARPVLGSLPRRMPIGKSVFGAGVLF